MAAHYPEAGQASGPVAGRPEGLPAQVKGVDLGAIPEGLYIPPDALEVFLDAFSGPLDLLLWLIRRNRMDIRDIPVAEVTRQYLHYLEEARRRNLELAAEYLLMAAWLAEIKARMLLPVPPSADDEEMDPRLELARRLEALAVVQAAAQALDRLPQAGRDFWPALAVAHDPLPVPPPAATLTDLVQTWRGIQGRLRRAAIQHHLPIAELALRQCMADILQLCTARREPWPLSALLPREGNRLRLAMALLAILELLRQRSLLLVSTEGGEWAVLAP